jgi:energy-coupling factor transporter ATP-binding protein EcfA2
MTVAIVASRALAGVDAPEVTVEVHLGPGLPAFHIVGLPDAEVREARDRVRAALNHAHFEFPARRITVNLAPAELPKDSSRFDLPIALGILAASGQLAPEALAGQEFAGELSLTGELRPVRGALAMALSARSAGRAFVLPAGNAPQAALAEGARILPAKSLLEVVAHLADEVRLAEYSGSVGVMRPGYPDFSEVKGQQQVKRALEVAAAGGHSVLMIGPPGTGKSMLASRFPGILPPLSESDALEVAAVHSVSTSGFDTARWGERPFRAPRGAPSAISGTLSAPGGHESLPLWTLRRPQRTLPLHARAHSALSRAHFGPAGRSHRHQARGPGAARSRAGCAGRRGMLCRHRLPGRASARGAARAPRQAERPPWQPRDRPPLRHRARRQRAPAACAGAATAFGAGVPSRAARGALDRRPGGRSDDRGRARGGGDTVSATRC